MTKIPTIPKFFEETYRIIMKYRITRLLHRILLGTGLIYLAHYLLNLWLHKNPTQEMKYEKVVFSEHVQELKEVYDSLEDDNSRSVFENILKYRVTCDWSYLKNLKKNRPEDNEKNQYIVPEISFSDHEVIVDCGAYNGDTVRLFYEKIPGCKIIALEPDETNFEAIKKFNLEGLTAIKCGVWSEDKTLSFSDDGGGTMGGAIDVTGNTKIEVKALDNLPECQLATFIKMDIEGSELEALKGAEKIIKKNRPKLAICIYHKPQDFFEIPCYIKKLNPDYKLFVHHHHTRDARETVLYAV